ncbi:GxxExxY protein [Psychrilyobacter piezotolerans]|uniref:GxxExxY protein n=2 Tax=Psychrilyobacter TaxID=623282 RepID=A0ABX9KEB3_9FUSO|nr:GxxExxY protein [Psychrilyobacter piezotolerans]RDE59155.1 GxxExxY protein [Psychrilyobacter sp. S5]REI39717.1 GxxExxY protein [Psychrilyobacter piezotolerans]
MMDQKVEQLSYRVIGLAIKVHKELGPGLLESTYERCLCYLDCQIKCNTWFSPEFFMGSFPS